MFNRQIIMFNGKMESTEDEMPFDWRACVFFFASAYLIMQKHIFD